MAIAERMLITVWMISFQVSLFFILINGLRTPSKSPPRGRLITKGRVGDFVKGLVFSLLALRPSNVMLKFAVKRELSQACLGYAEREQIEQR